MAPRTTTTSRSSTARTCRITGNTIRGATNFAILGAACKGNTNLVLDNNWLDGGHCTVKLQILNGYSETASVTGNKFGPNRKVSSCAFTAYPAVKLTQNGNTFETDRRHRQAAPARVLTPTGNGARRLRRAPFACARVASSGPGQFGY